MLAATKPIKYSDSSEIVKNESTSAKEKQNPVFTSTSVIDLAEFNNERVLLKYLLPRKALARADWRTQLKEEVENLQTLQLIPDSNIVKIKGFIEDIVFERRNNNFPCIISVSPYLIYSCYCFFLSYYIFLNIHFYLFSF